MPKAFSTLAAEPLAETSRRSLPTLTPVKPSCLSQRTAADAEPSLGP